MSHWESIIQRDDFWGDFINALFLRPPWRTPKLEDSKEEL